MKGSNPDLLFAAVGGKAVVGRFDGGDITSDAGFLLLAQADHKIGLTQALAAVMVDKRQASKVLHPLPLLLQERIYAIAAGYPDANDGDTLRHDPALKLACDRRPQSDPPLASQPTLSRLENGVNAKQLLRLSLALAQRVIAQLPADTRHVVLDVDASDDACHGQQEFEEFNAYYDTHCYLPLYLHVTGEDGRQRLLGVLLRPGKASATRGLRGLLGPAVRLLRARLPQVHIVVRADSGFGSAKVLRLCDGWGVDYVLGLAQNARLQRLSTPVQMDACLKYRWAGEGCREFGEFDYKAGSWDQARRVIVKAEITRHELNPRCVVTSLSGGSPAPAASATAASATAARVPTPEEIYLFYGGRGEQENRIKEMKLDVDSGRTSCHRFLANQCRLLWHAAAGVLLGAVQAAAGTRWASAQMGTLRLRLLKVGARVVESSRKVWVHLSSAFPEQGVWGHLYERLGAWRMVT